MAIDYQTYIENIKNRLADTTSRPSPVGTAASNTPQTGQSTADMIRQRYASSLAAQLAQARAAADKSILGYQTEIEKAPETYQPLRNEAYLQNAMAQRRLNERLANLGLSGAGGQALTLTSNQQANLLNTLGAADRQQQSAIDELRRRIAETEAGYLSNEAALAAQTEADLNAALQQDYYQQEALRLQQAAQEQAQRQAEFERAYNLFVQGALTPAQFKAITGIDVRNVRRGGGGSGGRGDIADDPRLDAANAPVPASTQPTTSNAIYLSPLPTSQRTNRPLTYEEQLALRAYLA